MIAFSDLRCGHRSLAERGGLNGISVRAAWVVQHTHEGILFVSN